MNTSRALDYELESLDGKPLCIGSQVRHSGSSSHSSGIIIDSANLAGRGTFVVLWAVSPSFEKYRIDSGGSIGVGTVAPSWSITVK